MNKTVIAFALVIVSFCIGYYFGWHMNNEKVLTKTVDATIDIKKQNDTEKSKAIDVSEKVHGQLQAETKASNEEKKQFKTHKGDVLSMPLPDDTIRLLNDASRR